MTAFKPPCRDMNKITMVMVFHNEYLRTMLKVNFKTALIGMVFLGAFSMVTTSCSSDDDETESTEQPTDGRKLRQLTITDVPITRATLDENGSAISALWTAGDKATYFNLSTFLTNNMDYGTLEASKTARTSTFTGTVRCGKDDYISLFYPATGPYPITYPSTDYRGTFAVKLSGQKGTLADIATNYHYVYGIGEVASVTETTATATISPMKSLLAVCKFTFNDGSNTIPVKTLSIEYADMLDNTLCKSGFPLTGTVNPFKKVNNVTTIVPVGDIVVNADTPSEAGLAFNFGDAPAGAVYAALFPVSSKLFHFTVTNDDGTYTGTATANLKAGKYYPVNLKLTKN